VKSSTRAPDRMYMISTRGVEGGTRILIKAERRSTTLRALNLANDSRFRG
jgi:hypothetical protein